MPSFPPNPRILVIRGGAIGDFILTLPAIGALREQWPQAHLEILGYPRILALAERRYYADTVRSIDAAAMARFFVPDVELDRSWCDYFGRFDLVISYLYDPDDIFSTNLSRAGVPNVLRGSPKPETQHASIHLARPIKELGIPLERFQPRLFPSTEDRDLALSLLTRYGLDSQRLIAIHPGSGGQQKIWPVDRWMEIIRWLRLQKGYEVLLVGGEADDLIRQTMDPLALPAAWNLPLPHLAALLERCRLFAGHDSGITHLAAAVNRPTLALFGPTSPTVWRPLGSHVRLLEANGPMETIPVSMVQQALETMLESK